MEKNVVGTVKWFNCDLGYGYIKRIGVGQDVFVHKSAIKMGGTLNAGDEVEFDVVTGRKGAQASFVTRKLENREDLGRKQYLAKDILGRVKRFDPELGYGFIIREDTNEDVFVHKSAIKMGSRVSRKTLFF